MVPAVLRQILARPAQEGVTTAELDALWLATWSDETQQYDVAAFARAVIAADRARAALAQPEPERLPPRVGHILRLAEIIREVDGSHDKGAAALAEAILSHPGSRWSPTTEPVPVAERLPGPKDCCGNPRNGRGRWCWGRVLPQTDAGTPVVWRLMLVECLIDEATHWLPHHALPAPGAEVG
jgi:hypothetical protein